MAATRKARKLLSKEDNPPGRAAVDSGLVPIMVEMLKSKNAKLVFEAAWTLTNVASTDCTAELAYDQPPLRRNAIPLLVQLLRHPNKDVREQCSWCLGNVAGDGVALRDIVLSTPNALENLILNIVHARNESMLKNTVWALSNFCRGKPQPPIERLAPALQTAARLLRTTQVDILRDTLWLLSYVVVCRGRERKRERRPLVVGGGGGGGGA